MNSAAAPIKLALPIVSALAFSVSAQSWNLHLSWTPAPAAEQVTNYLVYRAVGTNAFVSVTNTATASVTFTNVTPALYRFRVTALNAWGEGPPSAEVSTPSGLPSPVSSPALTIIINGQGTVNIIGKPLP